MPIVSDATLSRDIASAYVAAGAKVAAWVVISAILFRYSPAEYAILALVRATIGILNYTSLGLAPAMIRVLTQTRPQNVESATAVHRANPVLSYATPDIEPARAPYSNGLVVAAMTAAVGLLITMIYARFFLHLHRAPARVMPDITFLVMAMGVGIILRLLSDAPGAVLQTRSRITFDNALIALAEISWIVFTLLLLRNHLPIRAVSLAFAFSGLTMLVLRYAAAGRATGLYLPNPQLLDWGMMKQLLVFGTLVTLGQLADFLYAPVDYILINRLLSSYDVSNYAPAVQIDATLLLLVGGLANVLLPKTALAHAAAQPMLIRAYYIRGTLAALALLVTASIIVWVAAPMIFRLWLGDEMPTTQQILPLLLIHTVIGGSSSVGRSILLGIGKVKPFTIAVLIAGIGNVILSYIFVGHLDLGVRGIVLGTIVAAIGRSAIWMPWYILRTLKHGDVRPQPEALHPLPAGE